MRKVTRNTAGILHAIRSGFLLCPLFVFVTATGLAADAPSESDALARREADLARQYADLERSFLRLADVLATTDPRRAAVLRDAFDQARETEMNDRLGQIVSLLEAGQLLKAGATQEGAVEQFRGLLTLLEADGGDRGLADTKKQVREFLGRVTKVIARQRDIEGSTEAGAEAAEVGERQRKAANETAELARDLEQFAQRNEDKPADEQQAADEGGSPKQPAGEGPSKPGKGQPEQGNKPSDSKPRGQESDEPGGGESTPKPGGKSGQPAGEEGGEPSAAAPSTEEISGDDEASRARRSGKRLQEAEKRMREARKKLEEADRGGARTDQQKAIEELETARAELEEILRQLREEEVERLLVQLETRVRLMLRAERGILTAVEALIANTAMSARERQLEAVRIGREQEEVAGEVTRALALLRDDGSAVAVPEALRQIHDDCVQATSRLSRGAINGETTGIVADIVTGLEELLAALEKSRREQEQRKQEGGAQGRAAEPGEQPLVDQLAELKMLRSLQLRVNGRTQRFSQLLDEGAERATEPELREALSRLAERQRAIEKAARDIVTGRTE
jgi:hypothetical protein